MSACGVWLIAGMEAAALATASAAIGSGICGTGTGNCGTGTGNCGTVGVGVISLLLDAGGDAGIGAGRRGFGGIVLWLIAFSLGGTVLDR